MTFGIAIAILYRGNEKRQEKRFQQDLITLTDSTFKDVKVIV